ncbi:trihelix transcription factor ENAP2-like isoform X1 [Vicia villosa]|uniref:trihelix transcription factor ENAP2-like isoform X1 n=1 Tax=Vicia villosa TaxID=3911 RepID=UPI00273CF240|nr:trihelix transcription factor ENAP2-like isoform X1 [Vicia villosa]
MDSISGVPSPLNTAPPRPPSSSPFPGREDCWSEDATFTLIDAWGERYLDLNRGNLRQKHWQEVADAVNDLHAAGNNNKKARRTDVQCKNRIDTLKKKYKIEKARVSESDSGYQSSWPFFSSLDVLIGNTFPVKKHSPPVSERTTVAVVKSPPSPPAWIVSHPVGPRSGTQKRPAQMNRDDTSFRRNFSAFATAAAAVAKAESEETEEWKSNSGKKSGKRGRESDMNMECGYKHLAQAIERFGEVYERVEASKQRQMVELEMQRMKFAKDLEFQRMKLIMETQIQIQKIKRSKRCSPGVADSFS